MLYKTGKLSRSKMSTDESYEGETIEKKIRRIVNNKEPISDGAPIIFTERKEGVQPAYDIRTDRWEVACDAMDKVAKSHLAKREERHKTDEQKETERLAKIAKENMGKEGENSASAN